MRWDMAGFLFQWGSGCYIACILQVILIISTVPGNPKSKRRSGCPISIALDLFGDRWSLLIIRDLMVRGSRTFKQFQEAGEGIATNVLSDRLRKLQAANLITTEPDDTDGRKTNYRLTEKGIALMPVMLELLIWGARHEETDAPCALIAQMESNREEILAEVRRRWQERDPTPFLPRFVDSAGDSGRTRSGSNRVRITNGQQQLDRKVRKG